MNLLVLNSSKNWGGNERWSSSALNGLAAQGHEIFFITRNNASHWHSIDSKIKIIRAPFTNELSFKTKKIMSQVINKYKIDIIITTKRKDYVLGAQIKKKHKIPHILRVGISRPILRRDLIQRFLFSKRVDGIIVNANSLKSELLSYRFIKDNIKPENIIRIYNGYSMPKLKRKGSNLNNKHFLIRSAGRLTVHKGYDILICALNKLKKSGITFYAEIAGVGPELNKLTSLVESKGLKQDCKFIGEIKNSPEFFNEADVVVIPSRSEGIPNTIFEAWMAKKAVISTNVGGTSEVLEHQINGLICEPNEDQLFDNLLSLANNPKKIAALGKKGFTTLKNEFSVDRMVLEIETYLKSFI